MDLQDEILLAILKSQLKIERVRLGGARTASSCYVWFEKQAEYAIIEIERQIAEICNKYAHPKSE